jgi:hypothetical protein
MARHALGPVTIYFQSGEQITGDGTAWGEDTPPYLVGVIDCPFAYDVPMGEYASMRLADGTGWDNLWLDKEGTTVETEDGVITVQKGTYIFRTDNATSV